MLVLCMILGDFSASDDKLIRAYQLNHIIAAKQSTAWTKFVLTYQTGIKFRIYSS
jgi:hypothetical protein